MTPNQLWNHQPVSRKIQTENGGGGKVVGEVCSYT